MVSKVVLDVSAFASASLRIEDVGATLPSRTPVGTELHLGSQDLIRLAGYAAARGFAVSSFLLADGYLAPLGPDDQAEISDDLIVSLRQYGSDEVEAAIQDEYDGLYVIGITLIAVSGMRISIRRRGYVETSVVPEAERLLRAAWQELHLS